MDFERFLNTPAAQKVLDVARRFSTPRHREPGIEIAPIEEHTPNAENVIFRDQYIATQREAARHSAQVARLKSRLTTLSAQNPTLVSAIEEITRTITEFPTLYGGLSYKEVRETLWSLDFQGGNGSQLIKTLCRTEEERARDIPATGTALQRFDGKIGSVNAYRIPNTPLFVIDTQTLYGNGGSYYPYHHSYELAGKNVVKRLLPQGA